jgi:hypothetical protein
MDTANYPPNESTAANAAVSIRRLVNDEIADLASTLASAEADQFEFVCECGNLSCPGRVEMTLAQYRASPPGSILSH